MADLITSVSPFTAAVALASRPRLLTSNLEPAYPTWKFITVVSHTDPSIRLTVQMQLPAPSSPLSASPTDQSPTSAFLATPNNTVKSPGPATDSPGSVAPASPNSPLRRVPPSRRSSYPNKFSPHTSGIPRPAPPLFRPNSFWRRTARSAVTQHCYSPARYLIRRSSFIAAGLKATLDRPFEDLSAFGVEIRSREAASIVSLIPEAEII